VKRRRKCPAETKARIIEEALVQGATVAEVAARNGIGSSDLCLAPAGAERPHGISVAPLSCGSFVDPLWDDAVRREEG
jgi:Transposase